MSFESSAVNPVQRSLFPFRLTWLACVCAVPAHAGEVAVLQQVDVVASGISAPTEQDTHYQTKSSALATQTETPLVEIPQSVSVISQQQLDDRQPQSLDEALSSIAGLRQSNTLGGTQDAIAKRGFGGNRDNSILRNGMQSVQARNFTPTTQRIEVLKGPASLLYGIQDPGGVINVVTKKPQAEARYQAANYLTSFGGGGVQADLTGPLNNAGLSYRLIADKQQYDYWRNFGEIEQGVIAPSLAWQNDKTSILLDYEHMDYAVPFDRGTYIDTRTGKPLPIPRERRLDEVYNITTGRADSANLQFAHQWNERWSLHGGYGYSRNYYNDDQMRVMSFDASSGVVTRRADATKDALQAAHTATLYTVGRIDQGSTQHEVVTGVQYMHNYRTLGDLYRGSNDKHFNMYDPVYGTSAYPSNVSAADSDQTDKLRTTAFYLQDAWSLDEHWILVLGGRYDHFNELTGKGRPFRTNSLVSDSKFVPRAGVVYLIDPAWSVYTSYTESFRPNTSIANAIGDLPPEEGKSWELGSKWQDAQLTATVALFNIDKQNVLTSQTDTATGDTLYRVAGRVRSRGLESEINGDLGDNWSGYASYAYTDAEVIDDPLLAGTAVDGVPKHMATLGLVHQWPGVFGGTLRAGAFSRYTGSWYISNTKGAQYELPASTVFDSMLAYDRKLAGYALRVQFNVKNLFDETYYTSGVSNANAPIVAIGEPRQFLLTTTVGF